MVYINLPHHFGTPPPCPLCPEINNLNIVIKHVFICSNPYIYTTVVQEVYNRDRSPEVDDVEDLAAAATKHLEFTQKDIRQRVVLL